MQVIKKIKDLRSALKEKRQVIKTIGLVPTMGALHEGHLLLVRHAKVHCDCVVVSIFVNPKQFGPHEDFDNYPRDLEGDCALLEKEDIDFVFAPSVEEMWPEGNETFVDTTYLSKLLQGAKRPGHFCGVTSVVTKLFNITGADKAFLGEKDFQQLTIIRKMVRDLAFPIEIIAVPTLREEDGVAASSRNALLTKDERKKAVILPQALNAGWQAYQKGEKNVENLKSIMKDIIAKEKIAILEDIAILDSQTLKNITKIENNAVILLSVKIGSVRLLDQKELKIL